VDQLVKLCEFIRDQVPYRLSSLAAFARTVPGRELPGLDAYGDVVGAYVGRQGGTLAFRRTGVMFASGEVHTLARYQHFNLQIEPVDKHDLGWVDLTLDGHTSRLFLVEPGDALALAQLDLDIKRALPHLDF